MLNTATAHIDLAALKANLATLRRLTRSRILAVVKANAYGHGLVPAAQALREADGLAVARLDEALQLRSAGVTLRLVLLGTALDVPELELCSQHQIDVTIHDETSFELVNAQARLRPLRVWLKLDSGLHRFGLDPEAFVSFDRTLTSNPGILERIHMTHFSDSDNPDQTSTDRQLACFEATHQRASGAPVSLANSAAILSRPDTHGDWVRPGIALYAPELNGGTTGLRSVMTLKSSVIAVRNVAAGEAVGYGARWTSARPSRIATVGIGYGDGYPRHARNGAPVHIRGCELPLVGLVSMDSLMVDVTGQPDVAVGDEVTLWGGDLPVARVAGAAQTNSYHLLTAVSARVKRNYAF
jgi:alanine racemase